MSTCSPQYILRPERGVGAVLALDKDRSGLQALGVVPLADGDAEAGAVGSGEVGRSACCSNETLKQYWATKTNDHLARNG